METLLERWCESRPWCRLVCGGLGILLMGLTAWGVVLRPAERQCADQRQQLSQAARTNASLWPSASKSTLRPETQTAREMMPFSPLDFQGEGTTLLHWKPFQNGGELALESAWQAIPALFSRLAQRDVQVAAFTISPQSTVLRLRLELEHAK